MGYNLQLSNIIIYFTLPLSSELFEQSKKRFIASARAEPASIVTS
jgi:hypothetical protein